MVRLQGTYASFGICRTPEQWRNMGIVGAILFALLGGNTVFKALSSTRTNSRRKKALQELEKDS